MRRLTPRHPSRRRLPLVAALLLPLATLAACSHHNKPPESPPSVSPALSPAMSGSPTAAVTPSPAITVSPSPTATAAPARSPSPSPSAASVSSSPGPYTTLQAAETYASGQTGAPFTFSSASWQPGDTLQVLHGTPSQSAGYGGDYFFFFVNGHEVATHSFAQAMTSTLTSGTGFEVTFEVYKPGDPVCCPSGGQSTVQFSWNGTSLATSGSLAGANLS